MLTASLHSLGRNGPDPRVKVDLWPAGAKNFARSRRCEDGELQGQGGNSFARPKLGDKGRNVRVRHGGVVAARELLPLGEKVLEMAAPCGRILARPAPLGFGGVQNALDTTAKARSRLGFRRPNGLEHGEDIL